ncbi:tetratricopeptide repeat protein [Streptomyces sp. NBC_00201]|uniref:tetratricopeptide repeat protein n=1 Tax=unclassified Streptomyces TaxID=2593676 RepID=UPI00224FB994|nr:MULTISPECIES: tetratricopeptide repeat protein [unclassified Streptomyces]MCX5060721.1 tetratricopeptide repeat protein [Streptomyces sp. NBC_00452]MCX5248252.1 tetratricopeptide repeat protein [Streptomyces sp. NBC_00201]
MSRLSREKKRDQNRAVGSAALVTAPIDVRVPAVGVVGAWVGGVPVAAAAGEEIQQAVLNHLQRVALATGNPVHATVHDERIGYVVHLRVDTDGASSFTGEPVGMTAPAGEPRDAAKGLPALPPVPSPPPAPSPPRSLPPSPPPAPALPPAPSVPAPSPALSPSPAVPEAPLAEPVASSTEPSEAPAAAEPGQPEEPPRRDKPTHVLRATQEPVRETAPTFPLRAVSEPLPLGENVPTFPLRAVPEPSDGTAGGAAQTFALRALPEPPEDRAPGTVAAPMGEFGPPPPMDMVPQRGLEPEDAPAPRREPPRDRSAGSLLVVPSDPGLDPDPKPTPARGFDAVAEAVLGDEPPTTPDFLAEPMAQINEAVKAGRIETAAGLAESAVGEASAALGPEHTEVLRLRELTAYIAYLAGDPIRSFRLSLDLARIRRGSRDTEAAYGNIQSAASAWRAVRDPQQGLDLGRDLIGLWTELTAEDGPAADDIEQLESARARMGRLTERARKSAQPPMG